MRHRFIFISMTFLGILFASCNDWLDVQPEDQRKEDDMFSHYKGYRNALSGCYAAMGHTSVYGQKLTTSDIELLAGMWEMMDNSGTNYDLTTHNYNDGVRSTIQDIYSKMFNVPKRTEARFPTKRPVLSFSVKRMPSVPIASWMCCGCSAKCPAATERKSASLIPKSRHSTNGLHVTIFPDMRKNY